MTTTMVAPAKVRVCKVCGIEKPLDKFDVIKSTIKEYRRYVCRKCYYAQLREKNQKLYGYATTPAQRKSQSKYAKKKWARER